MSIATDILIWSIHNLDLVVFVLLFGVGLVSLPFIGMVSNGALPGILAEPLATNLWRVTLAGLGGGRLHQRVTDEYVIEGRTGEEEPENYWSRIAGQIFGTSYERDAGAFDGCAEHVDPSVMVTDGGATLPGKREPAKPDRAGHQTYLDTSQDAGLFVRAPEFLEVFRDSDGLDHVTDAEDQTMKEEAGDEGMETKWRVIFWLGMAFFGVSGGVGVFFVF